MLSQCLLSFVMLISTSIPKDCSESPLLDPTSPECLHSFGDLPAGFVPGLSADRGIDVQALIADLGQPTTLTVSEPFEEHFSGLPYRNVTVKYPHIEIVAMYEASRTRRDAWLESMVLSEPGSKLPCGLRIGDDVEKFRTMLHGSPERADDRHVEYLWHKRTCREGRWQAWHGSVTIHVAPSGEVTKVQWEYGSD